MSRTSSDAEESFSKMVGLFVVIVGSLLGGLLFVMHTVGVILWLAADDLVPLQATLIFDAVLLAAAAIFVAASAWMGGEGGNQ